MGYRHGGEVLEVLKFWGWKFRHLKIRLISQRKDWSRLVV